MINTNELLGLFLDYTFHILYSNIITKINKTLIDELPFKQNPISHLKPLVGSERIFLIFKGGTLMKKYFDNYIDKLINVTKNTKSNDIKTKYGNFIRDLNIGSNGSPVPSKLPIADTEIEIFKKLILQENFKISDTDYSLFINSDTNERFLVIHKYVIGLLGEGFDTMTSKFDEYFNDVQNNTFQKPQPLDDNLCSDETGYIESELLNSLRNILNNNINIENIINNNFNSLTTILYNVQLFIINLNNLNTKNLYELYDIVQIITLLMYLIKLNPSCNFYFIDIHNILKKAYKNHCFCINKLINNKFILLQINDFYTPEKITTLKNLLNQKYKNIPEDSDMFKDKYERGFEPKFLNLKLTKYNLIYNKIQIFNEINFTFPKRNSLMVLSKNSAININKIVDLKLQKNHYITYNETIRKTRKYGLITTDFDLMRSKFNIVINNDNIILKDDKPHKAKVPSEFIDVSIPRFEDISRKSFFQHITHHGYYPVSLKFNKIHIHSYSPSEVLEDLIYVLTNQNSIEPWLDKKYEKRLIRMIVLMIMIIEYNELLPYYDPFHPRPDYNIYKDFFTLCYAIYEYSKNENKEIDNYPYHIVSKFINGYDDANILNNKYIREYLRTIKNNSLKWFNTSEILKPILIHQKYESINQLVETIILWSFLIKFDNENLIESLNKYLISYLQTPIYNSTNITEPRQKFKTLLEIIFDYGFKLLYFKSKSGSEIIDINPPDDFTMFGGDYYSKYIKYKSKYISNK
jgi:hypothetical protein